MIADMEKISGRQKQMETCHEGLSDLIGRSVPTKYLEFASQGLGFLKFLSHDIFFKDRYMK